MVRLLVLMIFMTGCVHKIGLSNAQVCAADDMTLAGVGHGSSTAIATSGGVWATAAGSSQSISCVKPSTPEEKCDVAANRAVLGPVSEWNSGVTSKNLLLGLGYTFYVIPGVILYNVSYSDQEKQAYVDADSAYRQEMNRCTSGTPTAH